jgi:putative DNA methylase
LVNDPSEDFDSEQEEEAYRAHLFRIIERLTDVNAGTDQEVLDQAKVEIAKSNGGKMPRFWDPFCGGGSLPLDCYRPESGGSVYHTRSYKSGAEIL